eukprot:382457-Alexandrium_andersonii.AAC.1
MWFVPSALALNPATARSRTDDTPTPHAPDLPNSHAKIRGAVRVACAKKTRFEALERAQSRGKGLH